MAIPTNTANAFSLSLTNKLYDYYDKFIQSNAYMSPSGEDDAIARIFLGEERPIVRLDIYDKMGQRIGDSVRIIDGDTIEVYSAGVSQTKIRLAASDTFELSADEPFSASQGAALYRLLKEASNNGQHLSFDPIKGDEYGRQDAFLRIVDEDGNKADVDYLLLSNGITRPYSKLPRTQVPGRSDDYQVAWGRAQQNKKGIYSSDDFRKLLKANEYEKLNDKSRYIYDDTLFNTKKSQLDYDLTKDEYANKVKIGDVWLDIPPTHLTVTQIRSSNNIDLLGFESKPLASPVSRIAVKMNVVFPESKINTDLKRILTQFKFCPFNLIWSRDLWNKLSSDGTDNSSSQLSTLLSPYKSHFAVPVTMDEYVIYTIEGHPHMLGCSMQFSLFNYLPYYRDTDGGKLEYFEYNQTKFDDNGATLDHIFKPTLRLESSVSPYNIIIEAELKKDISKYTVDDKNPSLISILKVDKTLTEKEVFIKEKNAKKGDPQGMIKDARDPEDFINTVDKSSVTEIAHSISVSYRNNFAWQPISGYPNPTAQYLGPGNGCISINIKTSNNENVNKILKTFHEKIKENEYGFYDDRYMIKSSVTNFLDANIASISDVAVTSLDGHPGWFDVNIQFNKSSFEYGLIYNNSAMEFDDYWGLNRIVKIADNPEVKSVLDKARKEAIEDKNLDTILDRIPNPMGANVAGMDIDARKTINRELMKIAKSMPEGEKFITDNFFIVQGKRDALYGKNADVKDFIENLTYKYTQTNGPFGQGIIKDTDRVELSGALKDAKGWMDERKIGEIFRAGVGSYPSLMQYKKEIEGKSDKEIFNIFGPYVTSINQFASDGTILILRCNASNKEEVFTSYAKLRPFSNPNEFKMYRVTKDFVPNDGDNNALTTNDIVIHYKVNADKKHKDLVEKEKALREKVRKELAGIDLSKYVKNVKPWAAHRYFPDIDKYVHHSAFLSSTIGDWYYSDRFKSLGLMLNRLQSEVANAVCPTQDWEAWTSVYMQEQWGGLYQKIKDNNSPTSIIEGIAYPVSKREPIYGENGEFLSTNNGQLLEYHQDATDSHNYPFKTFQGRALQAGWGLTGAFGEDAQAYTTEAYQKRENWVNNQISIDTVTPTNTTTSGTAVPQIQRIYNSSQNNLFMTTSDGSALTDPAETPMRAIHPELLENATAKVAGPFASNNNTLPENMVNAGLRRNPNATIEHLKKNGVVSIAQTPAYINAELEKERAAQHGGPIKYQPGLIDRAVYGMPDIYSGGSSLGDVTLYGTNFEENRFGLDEKQTKDAMESQLQLLKNLNTANTPAMQDAGRKIRDDFLIGRLPTEGMENAFPTFKLYIISEDTSEIRFYSLDDYYDFRLVQDLMVIRDRNTPLHIMKARVVVDARYITTNPLFNPDAVRSGNAEFDVSYAMPMDKVDTPDAKKWDRGRAPLREGMRICLKLGYHTDPRALDTVFIGTIVSLNGRPDIGIYDIECHGDGRELTVPAVNSTTTYKAPTFADIISQMLRANTNVVHFGRVYGSFLERFSKKHYTILELGRASFQAAGFLGGTTGIGTIAHFAGWRTFSKFVFGAKAGIPIMAGMTAYALAGPMADVIKVEGGRVLSNVSFNNNVNMAARLSDIQGWFNGNTFNAYKADQQIGQILRETYKGDNNPVDDNIYAVDIWNGGWGGRSFNLNVNAKRTIWNVLQNIQRLYPGFALDVRPYGNRSTLYFGPIDFDYWRTDDPIQAMAPALTFLAGKDRQDAEDAKLGKEPSSLNKFQNAALASKMAQLGTDYTIKNKDEMAPRVPFQKQHIVTSYDHIIVNGIKSTPSRGWNTVVVSYSTKAEEHDNGEAGVITQAADASIDPGAVITKYANIDFTDDEDLAKFYALGLLKEGVEKLYGGTLIIKGNPKIEPYDKVYVFDEIHKMYGWIQVETVIHKFDSEMGFTTHIVPNMVCDVNGDAYLTTGQVARKFFFDHLFSANGTIGLAGMGIMAGIAATGVGAPILLLAGAGVAVVSAFAQHYFDDRQHSNSDGPEETTTRSESIEVQDYFRRSLEWEGALDSVRFGMYIGILKNSKSAIAEYKIKDNLKGVWEATRNAWSKTSVAVKGAPGQAGKLATIIRGEAAATTLAKHIGDFAKNRGIPSALGAADKGISTITKTAKFAGKALKSFWPAMIIGSVTELIPIALETIAVKYATKNNTIIVHPLWSKGRTMMSGLEGYKNNDLWMHTKGVIVNAKRTVSNAVDVMKEYYSDAEFNMGAGSSNVHASVGHGSGLPGMQNRIKNDLMTPTTFISDVKMNSVSENVAAEYLKRMLHKANSKKDAQHAFNILVREQKRQNLSWKLISATIAQESGYSINPPTSKAGAIGLMQILPTYKGKTTQHIDNAISYYPTEDIKYVPTKAQIVSDPGKYVDGIIYAGMKELRLCYDQAKSMINKEKFKNAPNKIQVTYSLTYMFYNGGRSNSSYPKWAPLGDYVYIVPAKIDESETVSSTFKDYLNTVIIEAPDVVMGKKGKA